MVSDTCKALPVPGNGRGPHRTAFTQGVDDAAIIWKGHSIGSADNVLLVHRVLEAFYDAFLITIVPLSDKDGETELKVRVLDSNKD